MSKHEELSQGRDPACRTRDNDLAGRFFYLVAATLAAAFLICAFGGELL